MILYIILGALVATIFTGSLAKPYLLLVFLMVISMLLVKVHRQYYISKQQANFFIISLFIIVAYMVIIYSGSSEGLESEPAEYISVLMKFSVGPLLLFSIPIIYRNSARKTIERVLYIFMIINIFLMFNQLKSGIITGHILGSLHSNYMGLIGLLTLIVTLLSVRLNGKWKHVYRLSIIIALFSIALSLSRGAALSAIVFFSIIYLWKKGIINRKVSRIYLPLAMIFIIAVTSFFSEWVNTPSAKALNEFSENVMGKRLDTGRSKLWNVAHDWFLESPVYGLGIEARKRWDREHLDGSVTTLSVHNYYLAILVEAGVLGLLLVLFFIYYILTIILSNRAISGVGFGALIAILIHQTTQVSLTTGTFTAGILIWTTLALIILGKSYKSESNNNFNSFVR
jgi:O-antigen ligase